MVCKRVPLNGISTHMFAFGPDIEVLPIFLISPSCLHLKAKHCTEPFDIVGNSHRYCIVYFSRKDSLALPQDDPAPTVLKNLGFTMWENGQDLGSSKPHLLG